MELCNADLNLIEKQLPLSDGVSLEIFNSSYKKVFESSGKWLHPLFELEDYIREAGLVSGELFLHDRIAGKAAAHLIKRLGIRSCFIDLISRPAFEFFLQEEISCGYNTLVERIDCQTEELLSSLQDEETIYQILAKRAGR